MNTLLMYAIPFSLYTLRKKAHFASKRLNIQVFLQENFLQENEPQKLWKLKEMLRKCPASNAWAAILMNADFS